MLGNFEYRIQSLADRQRAFFVDAGTAFNFAEGRSVYSSEFLADQHF